MNRDVHESISIICIDSILEQTYFSSFGLIYDISMKLHMIYTSKNGFVSSHGLSFILDTRMLHGARSETSYDICSTSPQMHITAALSGKYLFFTVSAP